MEYVLNMRRTAQKRRDEKVELAQREAKLLAMREVELQAREKERGEGVELKVQSERVIEAAKGCPEAKRVLEKLFPEAFKKVFQRGNVIYLRGATYLYLGQEAADLAYYRAVQQGPSRVGAHIAISCQRGTEGMVVQISPEILNEASLYGGGVDGSVQGAV